MTYVPEITAESRQVKIKTRNWRLMVMMLLVQVSLEHWLICTVGHKLSTDCFQMIISYFSHFVVTFIWWWRKVIEHLLASDLLWKTKRISNKHLFLWRVRLLFIKNFSVTNMTTWWCCCHYWTAYVSTWLKGSYHQVTISP